jgi:alpha-mannosidase
MALERTTVFLPCHTLDDFPTWLEEAEADDLLAAWTAAWHPALVAAVGAAPPWASIDLPVLQGPLLGIVPTTWDDRFAAQFDAVCTVGSSFVRRAVGVEAIEKHPGG